MCCALGLTSAAPSPAKGKAMSTHQQIQARRPCSRKAQEKFHAGDSEASGLEQTPSRKLPRQDVLGPCRSPEGARRALIVFLQNAWSPLYAGGVWPRRSWLTALARSRSGQRLRPLIDDFDCCENTTPIVGKSPANVVPPSTAHIALILHVRKPSIVVACGRQAEKALLSLWKGPLLAIPHPACRVVTNDLFSRAREMLPSIRTQIALRQRRGHVETEVLTGVNARRAS